MRLFGLFERRTRVVETFSILQRDNTVTKTELRELIANGESSGVEFKREELCNRELAKEIVAFANFWGGRILLGIDDDGTVRGLTRSDPPNGTQGEDAGPRTYRRLEEWVAQACRDSVHPRIVPRFDVIHDVAPNRDVAVVGIERGWNVHHVRHDGSHTSYLRVGSSSRDSTPEELARCLPQRGTYRCELRPVSGTSIADLDRRRLTDYFEQVRGQDTPGSEPSEAWRENTKAWARSVDEEHWRMLVAYREKELHQAREADWSSLLVNTGFLCDSGRRPATVAGLMLFGKDPSRFLPQARIDATACFDSEKGRAAKERYTLHGPIVRLKGTDCTVLEPGLVEEAVAFVRRNTEMLTSGSGVCRQECRSYPEEAVREAVINAIVHRDCLLSDFAIELSIYSNRLEVVSPGRLIDGITLNKIRHGRRSARNELLRDVMRDYECPKHVGRGVPGTIAHRMKEHNGIEPDFLEEEDRFIVRLWKDART